MLSLTKRQGESLWIGTDIRVHIINASPGRVTIGIDAPKHVAIYRERPVTHHEYSWKCAKCLRSGNVRSETTSIGRVVALITRDHSGVCDGELDVRYVHPSC